MSERPLPGLGAPEGLALPFFAAGLCSLCELASSIYPAQRTRGNLDLKK